MGNDDEDEDEDDEHDPRAEFNECDDDQVSTGSNMCSSLQNKMRIERPNETQSESIRLNLLNQTESDSIRQSDSHYKLTRHAYLKCVRFFGAGRGRRRRRRVSEESGGEGEKADRFQYFSMFFSSLFPLGFCVQVKNGFAMGDDGSDVSDSDFESPLDEINHFIAWATAMQGQPISTEKRFLCVLIFLFFGTAFSQLNPQQYAQWSASLSPEQQAAIQKWSSKAAEEKAAEDKANSS